MPASDHPESVNWYAILFGSEMGPMPFDDLKALIAHGELLSDDEVRPENEPGWIAAGTVDGLFPKTQPAAADTTSTAASKEESLGQLEWYCNVLGNELGPMSFDDLLTMAKNHELSGDDQIRHGPSGEWVRAETIDDLFRETESEVEGDREPVATSPETDASPSPEIVHPATAGTETEAESTEPPQESPDCSTGEHGPGGAEPVPAPGPAESTETRSHLEPASSRPSAPDVGSVAKPRSVPASAADAFGTTKTIGAGGWKRPADRRPGIERPCRIDLAAWGSRIADNWKLLAVIAAVIAVGLLVMFVRFPDDVCAVSGTVTYDGQSVENGSLRFDPVDGTVGPAGVAKILQGEYIVGIDQSLVPGAYQVTIVATRETGRQVTTTEQLAGEAAKVPEVVQYIPGRYNVDTELRVELQVGENSHSFHLEKGTLPPVPLPTGPLPGESVEPMPEADPAVDDGPRSP